MRIVIVAGARPNFVKVAPLLREMRRHPWIRPLLVHTGQHYDQAMSRQFFADLEIPPPDINLEVGSGSHAVQTAEVMRRIEPVLEAQRPDLLVVVGDVNSTVAAAITAAKMGIAVAHVEAGLRSLDRSMPEELNRVLTDAISELLFVTEISGWQNLLREGIAIEKVHFVGNVMIDALQTSRARWERSEVWKALGVQADRPYAMLTLHRPTNVDDPEILGKLLQPLQEVAQRMPLVFPVHPRARGALERLGGLPWRRPGEGAPFPSNGIIRVDPLGYLDCIALMSRARLVLTDSGGIQEETTILGVPCLTLRETTERPVTVSHGTNRVIGVDPSRILDEAIRALENPPRPAGSPPLWDGRAAARIVRIVHERVRPRSAQEAA